MAQPSRRSGSLTSVLLFLGAILAMSAGPAIAVTTGWDPHDQPQRGPFDLRWAGAYRQDADTIRVGISLWEPVRRRDFDGHHWILLSMNPTGIFGCPDCQYDADGGIRPLDEGGWSAPFSDEGYVLFRARVTHPNSTLFQVYLPASVAAGQDINVVAYHDVGAYNEYIIITAP